MVTSEAPTSSCSQLSGGEFTLCDVRDLSHGCVMALDKGRTGECYIWGNEEITFKEMCRILKKECGARTPLCYVSLPLAYKLAAFMEKKAKKTGKPPMMTTFAVYNLDRNNTFDYSKAKEELGYTTRPYSETLKDMADWLASEGIIDTKAMKRTASGQRHAVTA